MRNEIGSVNPELPLPIAGGRVMSPQSIAWKRDRARLAAFASAPEETRMQSMPLLRHIFNEESLTRGLGDGEAKVLVEWLAEWAELLAAESDSEDEAWDGLRKICRRARGISRFVLLWSEYSSRGAAVQLAGVERFSWPLPIEDEDPADLMERILAWEDRMIVV